MRMTTLTVEAVMAKGRKSRHESLYTQFMLWGMWRQREIINTASQKKFRDEMAKAGARK